MQTIVLAIICFSLGWVFAVVGIYLLAGPGWALIAASMPCFILSWSLIRGLARG